MKKLSLFLLVCIPFLAISCSSSDYTMGGGNAISGEGPDTRRTLDLDPFSGVKLAISANVTITQGSQQSVEIEAQDNIIDLIKTDVRDDVWKITTTKNIRTKRPINIYITIPSLSMAAISGSGDIIGTNTFTNSQGVTMGISGSGNITLDLEADKIAVGISGSGDLDLSGNTNNLSVGISGSGDVEALDLMTKTADVRISGSGNVDLHATDELEAKISGSGDIRYKGQPRISSRSSGSGGIEAI